MLVLGLDLSLACTGYAVWDSDKDVLVAHGNIRTKAKDDLSDRLSQVAKRVAGVRHGVWWDESLNQIAYAEQPIHNRLHSATTTLRIGMVHGAVRAKLWDLFGDSVTEVPIGTVKKVATGSGKADKEQMIAAAKDRWGIKLTSDEADAAFVAVTGFER